jgi:hypothetical protein
VIIANTICFTARRDPGNPSGRTGSPMEESSADINQRVPSLVGTYAGVRVCLFFLQRSGGQNAGSNHGFYVDDPVSAAAGMC